MHRELVLEQLLRGHGFEAAHALLALGDREHFDERSLPDTQREAGVAGRDESEEADAVHRTAPLRLGFEQPEREAVADELVTDRVVVAARAGEAHDIPVAIQVDILRWQEGDEQRRQTRGGDHRLTVLRLGRARGQPRRMAAAAAEAVLAGDHVAVVGAVAFPTGPNMPAWMPGAPAGNIAAAASSSQ